MIIIGWLRCKAMKRLIFYICSFFIFSKSTFCQTSCRDINYDSCSVNSAALLDTVKGVNIVECQEFCSTVFASKCKLFVYDRVQKECLILSQTPDSYIHSCGKISGPKTPDIDGCSLQSPAGSCSDFKEAFCLHRGSLLENFVDIGSSSICQYACTLVESCESFVYDNIYRNCQLLDSTEKECDLVLGPIFPPVQDCFLIDETTTVLAETSTSTLRTPEASTTSSDWSTFSTESTEGPPETTSGNTESPTETTSGNTEGPSETTSGSTEGPTEITSWSSEGPTETTSGNTQTETATTSQSYSSEDTTTVPFTESTSISTTDPITSEESTTVTDIPATETTTQESNPTTTVPFTIDTTHESSTTTYGSTTSETMTTTSLPSSNVLLIVRDAITFHAIQSAEVTCISGSSITKDLTDSQGVANCANIPLNSTLNIIIKTENFFTFTTVKEMENQFETIPVFMSPKLSSKDDLRGVLTWNNSTKNTLDLFVAEFWKGGRFPFCSESFSSGKCKDVKFNSRGSFDNFTGIEALTWRSNREKGKVSILYAKSQANLFIEERNLVHISAKMVLYGDSGKHIEIDLEKSSKHHNKGIYWVVGCLFNSNNIRSFKRVNKVLRRKPETTKVCQKL